MTKFIFAGDKKTAMDKSLFGDLERKMIKKYVKYIPSWIETYHLTFLTLVWSFFVLVFSWLAQFNILWLWGVSLMILLQYLSDTFDGAVGRYRKTGLVKWGYYMDHFFDWVFMSSLLIGYSFITEGKYRYWLFFVMAAVGAFVINAILSFAATNKFKIVYLGIGPTEIRLLFIIINTLLLLFGRVFIGWTLPWFLAFSVIGLGIVVYRTQKELWEIDMRAKKQSSK